MICEHGGGGEAAIYAVVAESRGKSEDGGLKMEDGKGSARPSSILHPPSSLPQLILIDGGKGQLNAACAELKKLGLETIPVIGLAKEFEEIYQPGESKPLRLGLIIRR